MAVLDTVFVQGLQALYGAHRLGAEQAAAARRSAASPKLRSLLSEGSHISRRQAHRLAKVFRTMGLRPTTRENPAMEGIRDTNVAMAANAPGPVARDLAHIAASQMALHYYGASYGTLREYARALGNRKAAKLLDRGLVETKRADRKYTVAARRLLDDRSGGHGVLRAVAVLGALAGGVALVRQLPRE